MMDNDRENYLFFYEQLLSHESMTCISVFGFFLTLFNCHFIVEHACTFQREEKQFKIIHLMLLS